MRLLLLWGWWWAPCGCKLNMIRGKEQRGGTCCAILLLVVFIGSLQLSFPLLLWETENWREKRLSQRSTDKVRGSGLDFRLLTLDQLSTGEGLIITTACPFFDSWPKKESKDTQTRGNFWWRGDLPVPCSYSRIFPLSARPHRVHRLSWLPSGWCKSELCMAGTQSRDWAPGRTASFFSKRRCGPSSPTFNPTLLLLLLLSRQANNQTSLLAEQDFHRNTTIRAKTLTQREREREIKRGREGRKGAPNRKIYTFSSNLCLPHGRVASLLSVYRISALSFFHRGGGGSVRVCAPCVFAREFVYGCVHAELLKADFSSPRTTRMRVVQLIGLSCGEMATAPPYK